MLWRWFGDPSTDSTRGDLLTGEIMNKAQHSINEGNEFLELCLANDAAEARYNAHRETLKRIGESLADFSRDDIVCLIGESPESAALNLKALIIERLTGNHRENFAERFDFWAEKLTEDCEAIK